jgi:hypothetical protein
MKSNRSQKRCPDCPEQCFCAGSQKSEDNQVGGRKHAPGIWLPYCLSDHAQFHANCRRAGVDFRKQSNKVLGQIQALKAHMVGMWMVVEAMEKQVKEQQEGQTNDGTT